MRQNPLVPSIDDRPPQLRARRLFRSPGLGALLSLGAAAALCVGGSMGGPVLGAEDDDPIAIEDTIDADAGAGDGTGSLTIVVPATRAERM